MKRKTVALYSPYLDSFGGGERHILSILQILEEEGFEIHIYWDSNVQEDFQKKLNIDFTSPIHFHKNIFHEKHGLATYLELKQFDMFFYVTDGSYFFSGAKKTFIFCTVPQKDLYPSSLINKVKTLNCQFIINSKFSQSWLKKWGVNADIIYPYIAEEFFDEKTVKKDTILSVGRFFQQLHAKRQDIMIDVFKKYENELKDFCLVLAGGLKEEDKPYFESLKQLAKNDTQIVLEPNAEFHKLLFLYKSSHIYWHFAGWQVDENTHPEQTEHLGITPLEAMAAGCIVFCYKAGGLKETVQDGENGFLFSTPEELMQKMQMVLNDDTLQMKLKKNGYEFVKKNFSYEVFKQTVKHVILHI